MIAAIVLLTWASGLLVCWTLAIRRCQIAAGQRRARAVETAYRRHPSLTRIDL